MLESFEASLVRIYTADGHVVGAGFLVGERHILTCAHVIVQALGLADDTLDSTSSTVSLDFPHVAPHTMLTAEVIHFAPAEQVWEHTYRAFGFPAEQDDGVWSHGLLLGRQGTDWIQLEDDKIPGFGVIVGFSGAPVWDKQLKGVVGMIVASIQPATAKVAFAIPTDVLIAAWPQLASLMRPLVPRNPYKGLNAFTEHDTRDFFGRETLIEKLATAVETVLAQEQKGGPPERLLAVLGPSGSGKSSVVMAGLLPCLKANGVLNSEEWMYIDRVFPGAHPLEVLAVSLAKQLSARGAVSIHDELKLASVRTMHLLASELVASSQQRTVLIVDQFEEAFTLTTDEAERQRFFELLTTAVTEPRGPLFVILTLRADFYDRPMHYPELYRLIDAHHVSVLPLERDELRSVIEQPANLTEVQLTFEKGLAEELLFATQGQSGALPLLEFTLDQLVQRRNGHQLTLQAYQQMGGVKGALSQHAEETYQGLPSNEHRQMARDVFLRLVEPGTTEQDVARRRAARSEFERADPVQRQRLQDTLEAFISARLLTTNRSGDKITIEVSHEALIREWPRLTEWLREARDDIYLQQTISKDADEWERRNKPRDRLYRGSQLKEAQAWANRSTPSDNERTFLDASAVQRVLYVMSVTVIILLLLSTAGVSVWFLSRPDPTHVTNLQDDGSGSLRWAIDDAPPKSTISFDASLRGNITLSSADLNIAKDLTIRGPGAGMISINSDKSGYFVNVLRRVTVTISDLTFIGSKTSNSTVGGVIVNEGTLTLSNSTISGNLTHRKDLFTPGGIFNAGMLTLSNSTVSNNTANDPNSAGGGIFIQSVVNATRASIAHVDLTFSTIFGNSASSGGDIAIEDTATSINGNSISITQRSQVKIRNSIVAGNPAHPGSDIVGMLTSYGYNLFQGNSDATFNPTTSRQHGTDKTLSVNDLSNLFAAPVGLRNNGGSTQTYALFPSTSNPAIDKVPLADCHITVPFTDNSGAPILQNTIITDQRGMKRPDDGNEQYCDIGAYESP